MKTLNEQIQRLRDILHTCYESIASKGGTLPPVGERNMTNLPDAVESVPQVIGAELEELTITQNGEYLPSEGVAGFSKVTANVVPTKRVVLPNGTKIANSCIDENGYWAAELVDVSLYTTFLQMFANCSSLQHLNVSGWDTSNAESFYLMFVGCSSLQNLDVRKWDTSNVTTFQSTFSGCSSLQNLDVSNWDTSKVTNMGSIFSGCSSLQNLDVSNWDTSKVTNMNGMFSSCSSLQHLDLSKWDTSKVTDMNGMFISCSSLQHLDLSKWDTSKVTTFQQMFNGCRSLQNLNISNIDASIATSLLYIFSGCYKLSSLVGGASIEEVIANNISCFKNLKYGGDMRLSNTIIDRASLRAVINGLADLTGQTAQTLTLGATLRAKLTNEDIAVATNKNWTVL